MHFVIFYYFFLYRPECAQTYMKSHVCYFNAFSPYFLNQLVCEMQSCRWSRSRASLFRINRLVSFLIFKLCLYIRRQRHSPQFFQYFLKHSIVFEFHYSRSLFSYIYNLCLELASPEFENTARFGSSAWLYQCLPPVDIESSKQKEFDFGSSCLFPENAGGYNSCIIEYKAVPWIKTFNNFLEFAMPYFSCFSVKHHQFGFVSLA